MKHLIASLVSVTIASAVVVSPAIAGPRLNRDNSHQVQSFVAQQSKLEMQVVTLICSGDTVHHPAVTAIEYQIRQVERREADNLSPRTQRRVQSRVRHHMAHLLRDKQVALEAIARKNVEYMGLTEQHPAMVDLRHKIIYLRLRRQQLLAS